MVPRMGDNPARISPTAHFTGYTWYRHGLGDSALRTRTGHLLVTAFRPIDRVARWAGGPTLRETLLGRHTLIDRLLDDAITRGEVGQVLEVAAGLSPRGLRFTRRHDRLRYIEGDLPGMASRKRRALAGVELPPGPHHSVVDIDALASSGPGSLDDIASRLLDPGVGLAIITEGLVNYFDRAAVEGMWRRFAAVLARFPQGLYLSDLHLADDMARVRGARAVATLVSVFARGRVHMHFADETEAGHALLSAGFGDARLHPVGGSSEQAAPVRIVEARSARRG
jgi:O-methyltransferase involved in polyketide biosynthesis